MPAVALGWPKNKKYASRNAAAVQYRSLLYKKESEGPTAPQTDSSDFHAWAKVFLPGARWIPVNWFREDLGSRGSVAFASALVRD
jgi:hypothetical protein